MKRIFTDKSQFLTRVTSETMMSLKEKSVLDKEANAERCLQDTFSDMHLRRALPGIQTWKSSALNSVETMMMGMNSEKDGVETVRAEGVTVGSPLFVRGIFQGAGSMKENQRESSKWKETQETQERLLNSKKVLVMDDPNKTPSSTCS